MKHVAHYLRLYVKLLLFVCKYDVKQCMQIKQCFCGDNLINIESLSVNSDKSDNLRRYCGGKPDYLLISW